jgi:hypothetical protein
MGLKLTNLNRCVALVGIIFLAEAIRYVERQAAATGKSHFITPVLTYARTDLSRPATNSGFLDDINLSLDPPVTTHDLKPNHAGFNFQKDLPSGSFDQLPPPRSGDATKTALTVKNRELNYELFGSEGFAFKLYLKPGYPNPEAPIPTRLDPGLGVSFKF